MIEIQILIPVRANDGAVFTAEHHAAFEAELVAIFGGFTMFANALGAWADEGIIYRDETRLYAVFVASLLDGSKVGIAVAIAKDHYGQLAIAIRYLGLSEIL